MKFKLDENLGTRAQRAFRAAGYDVQTVREQHLRGCSDQQLFDVCRAEERCLVTLDLDFANVLRFPPHQSSGIVVIRVPRNPTPKLMEQIIIRFLDFLARMPLQRRLWVVEMDRIRIYPLKELDNEAPDCTRTPDF
ncbi:MAG: DUF5615 family PIN-like protein [Thermoflexales bacterium]|nr:DUF5615 family PIN-like protein [Thermoflexales bacterium]